MSELINVSEMNQAVNTITAQMIVLANNIVSGKEKIDSRIASFEKQTWYKRMWNSLNGKMKGTKEEFEQNKENIVIYILKVITAVYDENKFNQDMLLSIKQKIADIYYLTTVSGIEQILKKDRVAEIRNAAKELSVKINNATENIEVLSILADGIESGKFNYNNPIATICDITSKLDSSVLCDDNISETVCGAVNNSGIIANSEKSIAEFMADVINIPAEKNGEVYLELASMDDNLWASMFAELMESYNMLSKMERMAKKKDAIIKNILEKNDIDEATAFTASDLLEALLATRIEMADMTANVNYEQIEESVQEEENYSDTVNDENYDEDDEDYEDVLDEDYWSNTYRQINDINFTEEFISKFASACKEMSLWCKNSIDSEVFEKKHTAITRCSKIENLLDEFIYGDKKVSYDVIDVRNWIEIYVTSNEKAEMPSGYTLFSRDYFYDIGEAAYYALFYNVLKEYIASCHCSAGVENITRDFSLNPSEINAYCNDGIIKLKTVFRNIDKSWIKKLSNGYFNTFGSLVDYVVKKNIPESELMELSSPYNEEFCASAVPKYTEGFIAEYSSTVKELEDIIYNFIEEEHKEYFDIYRHTTINEINKQLGIDLLNCLETSFGLPNYLETIGDLAYYLCIAQYVSLQVYERSDDIYDIEEIDRSFSLRNFRPSILIKGGNDYGILMWRSNWLQKYMNEGAFRNLGEFVDYLVKNEVSERRYSDSE